MRILAAITLASGATAWTVNSNECNSEDCSTSCHVAQSWKQGECKPLGNAPPYHVSQMASLTNDSKGFQIDNYKGDNCSGASTGSSASEEFGMCKFYTSNKWISYSLDSNASAPLRGAQDCQVTVTNKNADAVTLCLRKNGNTPGAALNVTVASGDSTSWPCLSNANQQSWQMYFAKKGLTGCGWDKCEPPAINTGTCTSYPYVMGLGLSPDNGNWYGSLGWNWDGAGQGYNGSMSSVGYGVRLQCSGVNNITTDDTCDGDGCKCDTTHKQHDCQPNYGKPNSGVVECDPTDVAVTII